MCQSCAITGEKKNRQDGPTLTHNRDLFNIFGVKKLNKQKGKFLEKLFHWRIQIELCTFTCGKLKNTLNPLFLVLSSS